MLGSSEIVRTVLLHRSVAAGEVTFGFSDIDLLVIVRQPRQPSMDGEKLLNLYERVQRLKWVSPRLGHVEIHDPGGFQSSFHMDTFRGSKDRRSATLLSGESVDMPEVQVRREDALRRFTLWPFYYLSPAIARRDRRNLRKIALEMWSAYATATGLVSEPFLTRRETEAFLRSVHGEPVPGDLNSADGARTFLFLVAEQLHRELLPPLARIRKPILIGLPPHAAPQARPMIVLPSADSPLPDGKLHPNVSFFTPELLDLSVQFALPFLYWSLPPPLRDLGIRQPSRAAFLQYARYFSHSFLSRLPGFISQDTALPGRLNARIRHIVEHLQRGETPPGVPDIASSQPVSVAEYYRNVYPRLLADFWEIGELLDKLEALAAGPPPVA